MFSLFLLKENTPSRVVYYYSVDKVGAPSDGEIELDRITDKFKTIKTATGDDDGSHARFMMGPLRGIIVRENCPEKRFVAVG